MRAIVIEEFGGPEVLKPVELPDPAPGEGEVRIAVRATSVNPVDYKIRAGRAPRLCPSLPAVLHADCAGIIDAIGPKVTAFKTGDEVYSYASGFVGKQGALAQRMVADARMVAHKPASLGFEEAAALPLVLMTAWYCLFDMVDLNEQSTVLIQGGTGGVGHVAIQVAKALGATVSATCGSEEKCAVARRLGAANAYDYTNTAPVDWVNDATAGTGFDVVFNTPGEPAINEAVQAAKDFGTILDILGHFPTQPGFQGKWLTFKSVLAARPITHGENVEKVGEVLATAADWVEQGKLTPLVDERRFNFDHIGGAHETAEFGRPMGKIVVTNPW